jgi:hypothetical protein
VGPSLASDGSPSSSARFAASCSAIALNKSNLGGKPVSRLQLLYPLHQCSLHCRCQGLVFLHGLLLTPSTSKPVMERRPDDTTYISRQAPATPDSPRKTGVNSIPQQRASFSYKSLFFGLKFWLWKVTEVSNGRVPHRGTRVFLRSDSITGDSKRSR